MQDSSKKRILVVANKTAATPLLLEEVRTRAQEEDCTFALLVPDVPDQGDPAPTLALALPLLQEAAGSPVEGFVEGPEPFAAIRQTLASGQFDEVIISTLPQHVSKWLERDLPRRVVDLGVPVTVVTAAAQQPA
jgi:hypothetical protein